MSIKLYTDPTEHLIVKGTDLTGTDVYVTFAQGDQKVSISGENVAISYDGQDTHIDVNLTQEQTALFKINKYSKSVVEVQVNWVSNNKRNATNALYIELGKNLEERIIR